MADPTYGPIQPFYTGKPVFQTGTSQYSTGNAADYAQPSFGVIPQNPNPVAGLRGGQGGATPAVEPYPGAFSAFTGNWMAADPNNIGFTNVPGSAERWNLDNAFGQSAASRLYGDISQQAALRGDEAYNQQNAALQQGLQARNLQLAGIDQMNQAMLGYTPSVAQLQQQRGLSRAMQQASSMAASARGGGANLAAAQRLGMQQQGQLAGTAVEQNALLRANEMAQARGQYAQATAGLRGGDVASQQAALSNMASQQQQALAYRQMGFQAGNTQLQANIARDQYLAQNYMDAERIQAGISEGSANRQQQAVGAGLAAGGAAIGSIAGPVGTAIGGAAGSAAGKYNSEYGF